MSPSASREPGFRWRPPLSALRQRLQQWFHSRVPPTATLALTQRNVYILPTRAGTMLALTLLVLLVASINYQLNLGYLLTFLLTGATVVGMHVCHGNLRGIVLHLSPPTPVYAGQAVVLDVQLTSQRDRTRYGLALGVIGVDAAHTPLTWTDVPAQSSARVQVSWPATHRGRHAVPPIRAQTLFPLGTFRVWTVWRPAAQVLIYPAPEASPPTLPMGAPEPGQAGSARQQDSGEFDGVRSYRRGDPQKTVVWKKAAQAFAAGRDDLVSRDAHASQRQQLWLDHAQCGHGELEARLSRLTAWVLTADRLGLAYGLRLSGQAIAPDRGPSHRARCLEALALA